MRCFFGFVSHRALGAIVSVVPLACPASAPDPRPSSTATENSRIADFAEESAHQLDRERRLRDADRLRLEADRTELNIEVTTLWIWAVVLSILLLAQSLWLATEIRRRRVLTAVMSTLAPPEVKPEHSHA